MDSFSGSSVSNHVKLTNMEQKNGALSVVDRTKSSNVIINLEEDASAVTENFTIEFTSKRELTYATTDFHFYGKDGKRYTTIRWWSVRDAAYALVYYRESSTSSETKYSYKLNSEIGSEKEIHVKLVFNTTTKTFSLWINGYEIVSDVFSLEGADSVVYMKLENTYPANGSYAGTGYGNAALYDFAYYTQMKGLGISNFSMDYNPYDKKVSVASPVGGTAKVIVASYMGNQMISATMEDVSLKEHDDVLADTSELLVNGADRVVVYLWEGLGTLKPLCESVVIEDMISTN